MSTAINTFKTVTANLLTSSETLYTAPAGITSIVLMAHIANVTNTPTAVTFAHKRNSIETELVKDFVVADNDAISATTGKLILEEGDSIVAAAGVDARLKATLSILESRNA
jgi:hypothetical protein